MVYRHEVLRPDVDAYRKHPTAHLNKVRMESRVKRKKKKPRTQKVIGQSDVLFLFLTSAMLWLAALHGAAEEWNGGPARAIQRKAKHCFPQIKCFSAIYVLFFSSKNSAQF